MSPVAALFVLVLCGLSVGQSYSVAPGNTYLVSHLINGNSYCFELSCEYNIEPTTYIEYSIAFGAIDDLQNLNFTAVLNGSVQKQAIVGAIGPFKYKENLTAVSPVNHVLSLSSYNGSTCGTKISFYFTISPEDFPAGAKCYTNVLLTGWQSYFG